MFEDVEGKDATNVTLAGLLKYVVYEIQILAYTRMGDGILSTKGIVRTDEDVPGPPIIIYFPNVTYTSAVVVWNPPQEPNGIITGYKVAYRKESSSTPGPEVELGPNIREYMVDSLRPNSWYQFRVAATNDIGTSDFSLPSAEVPTLSDKNFNIVIFSESTNSRGTKLGMLIDNHKAFQNISF
nr:hypothetical protein BaRGS_024944 [Batillaria attramentaria]